MRFSGPGVSEISLLKGSGEIGCSCLQERSLSCGRVPEYMEMTKDTWDYAGESHLLLAGISPELASSTRSLCGFTQLSFILLLWITQYSHQTLSAPCYPHFQVISKYFELHSCNRDSKQTSLKSILYCKTVPFITNLYFQFLSSC